MKTIKCKCGNRIAVLDKTGSLYVVNCNKCGLKVLNIFVDSKGAILKGNDGVINRKEKQKHGINVEGFW